MSGAVTVLENGNFEFTWATEFDIRDSLAEIAALTGWFVDTEHVVHGWGRPDLYLGSGFVKAAVEIKTDLLTKSACRKAVQQAAGYHRAMPGIDHVLLVAASIDEVAMSAYESSYPEVWVLTTAEFVSFLRHDEDTLSPRRLRAAMLTEAAEKVASNYRRAYAGLPDEPSSEKGAR